MRRRSAPSGHFGLCPRVSPAPGSTWRESRSKQDYSKALFVGGRASDDLKSSDLKGILIGLLLNPR